MEKSSVEGEKINFPEIRNKRIIHLIIIFLSLVVLVVTVLVVSTKFNVILPVFFGIFFVLSLIRGDSESDENISWASYIGKYLRGIVTFCMVIFGIFTILWIWNHFSPFLILLVIAMIAISVRFYRKYTLKGQNSELKKIKQLRRYNQIHLES